MGNSPLDWHYVYKIHKTAVIMPLLSNLAYQYPAHPSEALAEPVLVTTVCLPALFARGAGFRSLNLGIPNYK